MSRRIALVTGGNRGIGRAIVEDLVESGWHVALTFRSGEAEADEVVAGSSGHAAAYRLDVRDANAVDAVVRGIEDDLGPVDGLVNNAGIRTHGLLAMTSDAAWQDVVDTNLGAMFRLSRAALPGMLRRRRGAIVNVSSLGALHGVAGQGPYAASKAGALGLTRSLAREVGRRGVRVNAIAPGLVVTDMTTGLEEAALAALRANECLPDGVDVRSVAATARFLLSDDARSITGQCLVVDGGASA